MAKKSSFIEDFKKFVLRGNVMASAVGIIIGTAFTAIVQSLVNDIIMPVIGWIFGGFDFTTLMVVLSKATDTKPELALTYGMFIQAVINFILIGLVIFIMVRNINKASARRAVATPTPPKAEPVIPADVVLLTEIRDLLQKKK